MTIRSCLSLLMFSTCLAAWAVATPAPAEPPAGKIKAEADDPLAALKQGVPAETVKTLLGQPVEIRPMKAPSGKAEVWVFVKEVSRRVEQIQATTPDQVVRITEADGSVTTQVTKGQTRVHDVHYVTEEVVEVLLFNAHCVTHKVTRQERKL